MNGEFLRKSKKGTYRSDYGRNKVLDTNKASVTTLRHHMLVTHSKNKGMLQSLLLAFSAL
jgi:hypothetical protein